MLIKSAESLIVTSFCGEQYKIDRGNLSRNLELSLQYLCFAAQTCKLFRNIISNILVILKHLFLLGISWVWLGSALCLWLFVSAFVWLSLGLLVSYFVFLSFFCVPLIVIYCLPAKHGETFKAASTFRGTQREYSSKPLKHSIVKRILVFKR